MAAPDRNRQQERRIWLVLDLNPKKRGSLEQAIVALAARLQELHVTTTLIVSAPPIEWLRTALVEHGVAIRVLDFRRPAMALARFAAWLSSAPPDLVHFQFVRAHSPLVLAARAACARVVVHDHIALDQPTSPGRGHSSAVKKLLRALKWLRSAALDRFVDTRLAVSGFVAATVTGAEHFPPERIEIVPNGVDVGRFLGGDRMVVRWERRIGARPVIACVSRMAPEKGVDVLLRAVSRLPADAVLLIAGDGPDASRCHELARTLGIDARVHFLGLRDDVENIYAAADVVVMPSLWDEAFGLCVVEAMASGKPIVVADSGAMPEIIGHGSCGAVVRRGDDAALADAIRSLMTDRARAEALGQAARQRAVEVYPIARWANRVVAAYARLLPGLEERGKLIEFVAPPTPPPAVASRDAARG